MYSKWKLQENSRLSGRAAASSPLQQNSFQLQYFALSSYTY